MIPSASYVKVNKPDRKLCKQFNIETKDGKITSLFGFTHTYVKSIVDLNEDDSIDSFLPVNKYLPIRLTVWITELVYFVAVM